MEVWRRRRHLFCVLRTFRLNIFLQNRTKSSKNNRLFDLLEEMPKNVSKMQQKNIFAHRQDKSASEIYVQVIGNGAKSSSRSVYLFTDQCRYLFNCGEGTQRLAHEYKIKLSKLEHIFFTHGTWENIGGLPGLVLTMQSIGVQNLTLHGPKNINSLFDLTKGFMLADDIQLEKRNPEDGGYSDHIVSIKYFPIYGSVEKDKTSLEANTYQQGAKDASTEESARKKMKLEDRLMIANEEIERDVCLTYVCKFTNKPGHLVLEKCVEFGVPPGPLLGDLKSGKDITLPNGQVVTSASVLTAEDPGPVLIIVDCPTANFLESLLASEEFESYQQTATLPENIATLVVHFTPQDVVSNEKYQKWLHRFHPSTDHIVVNESNSGPTSSAVHMIQYKLNLLHEGIFPLLKEDMDPANELRSEGHTETLLKYYLRPKQRSDRSAVITLNLNEIYKECNSIPGFTEVRDELKSKLQVMPVMKESNNGNLYPELVFLGTGSSVPSKVRNTSAILINLSSEKSLLMDCGEGTFMQLCRFYGNKEVDSVLRRICGIFISHLHADHHIGLIEVVKRRRLSFKTALKDYIPLHVLTCQPIMNWLQQYQNLFEPITDFISMTNNASWCQRFRSNDDRTKQQVLEELGLTQLFTVPVRHCRDAFGIVLTLADGWKLVYSGDTMPCDSLVEAGENCDLLIHEATMEDELESEAVLKRHSTTSQAIEQGIKMGAKFTLLTHFSQRYAKVPIFTERFGSNVGIAFDNLRVSLPELSLLPNFIPALKTLFAEHYEEMQEKTTKRLRRQVIDRSKV